MIDYDATIAKFKRGGSAKLEASHELIMSIHNYIGYLIHKYHPKLYDNYSDDALSYCHLFLLERIYLYDPKKARFITWARQYILTGLAEFYGHYLKPVKVSRGVGPGKIYAVYLGVPDNIHLEEHKVKDVLLIKKVKDLIIDKFDERRWNIWNDYQGFENGYRLTLKEICDKYGFNSKQAVSHHLYRIREYLKTKLDEII